MPIVAGIACGLCGAKFDNSKDGDRLIDLHWKQHSRWDRFRYWLRAPWLRVGAYNLRIDSTGMLLFKHREEDPIGGGYRLICSRIWHRRQISSVKHD